MKMTKRQWTVYLATSVLTIAIVYALTTDNIELHALRAFSRGCQSTARTVGMWGLKTERLYLTILEQGRMI
jgi:hypothetical protein